MRTSTWNHNKFRLKHMAALGHNDLTAGFTGIAPVGVPQQKNNQLLASQLIKTCYCSGGAKVGRTR